MPHLAMTMMSTVVQIPIIPIISAALARFPNLFFIHIINYYRLPDYRALTSIQHNHLYRFSFYHKDVYRIHRSQLPSTDRRNNRHISATETRSRRSQALLPERRTLTRRVRYPGGRRVTSRSHYPHRIQNPHERSRPNNQKKD